MQSLVFLTIVGLVLLFGPLVAGWLSDRRQKQMAAVAQQFGWRFTPGTVNGQDARFRGFEVFERGYNRLAYNTLQGEITITTSDGRPVSLPVVAGDFRYTVKTDKGEAIQRFSYLLAALPSGRRGELVIRPEGRLDKYKSAMGFDDIDLESVEFSDRFHVSGSDKRFVYDVLHPRMVELFLNDEPPRVEVNADRVCLTECEHFMGAGFVSTCRPEDFVEWVAWAQRFADLWPRHLESTVEAAVS